MSRGLVWRLALAAHLMFSGTALFAANGCLPGDFQDRRGDASIVIANDNLANPFLYRPRCVRISAGTEVRFQALPDFGMHPLFAGAVVAGVASFDPSSPIGSATNGTEHVIRIDVVGEFPYYCDFHFNQGMQGSILVVPELFGDGFELEG